MEAAQIPQDMIIQAMHKMRKAELCIRNNGGHIKGRFNYQLTKRTWFVEKMGVSMD